MALYWFSKGKYLEYSHNYNYYSLYKINNEPNIRIRRIFLAISIQFILHALILLADNYAFSFLENLKRD